MNIKKCSKCGWEYPGDYAPRKCKYCGTQFKMGVCAYCHQWADKIDSALRCKACNNKAKIEWERRKRQKATDMYKDWCAGISKIQTPYQTLTEEQWLDACKYFGACAYCGERDIAARSMFIKFKNGGRYCDWNVIPSCEECETSYSRADNPFLYMNEQIYRSVQASTKRLGWSRKNLQRIVDYLGPKMEARYGEEKQDTDIQSNYDSDKPDEERRDG